MTRLLGCVGWISSTLTAVARTVRPTGAPNQVRIIIVDTGRISTRMEGSLEE